ncbi:hypothetical protein [Pontibacter burrus]|uniref:Uncharacterized protein n=1 Tax=Pontibacter burrus TaxID=2704466 RepID=A0A6B3LK41_9BACT|nr:hypothetical protein [Pontibacter burrus]NEM97292.1 hypothetical protein [Pontibacter burrus]
MKTILPLLIIILTVFAGTGCRQENVSPIRNVRFDPKLLNPLKIANNCTNYSYKAGRSLRHLGTVHTGQVVVAFRDGMTDAQRTEALSKHGFVTGILSQRASQSGMMYTLGLVSGLNCAQAEQAVRELTKDKAIVYAGPMFLVEGGQAVGLSNEVLVRADATGIAVLQQKVKDFNGKISGPLGADTYMVQLNKQAKGNALDFVNVLNQEAGILNASPDFMLAP